MSETKAMRKPCRLLRGSSILLALIIGPSTASAQTAPAQTASALTPPPLGPSIEERVATTESTLARLLRTSVSGYIQARATLQEGATPESNLFVRRARLNLRHGFDRGRFALSFDGGQNQSTVKDAYFDLFLTRNEGQRQGLVLRSGQFLRPFGFEVERSAPDREFPERPFGWGVLFPGNRDQGFDLSYGLNERTILNAAIVNGGGTSTTSLSFRDADDDKDVLGRVRHSLFSPRIDLAASIYRGRQTVPAAGTSPAFEGDRNRWSLAANVYDLAGGTLRAEYVGADDLTTNLGPGPARATAPAVAWYAAYVHPIGASTSLGIRYDEFDPDTDDRRRLGGDGEQQTLGAVVLRSVGDPIRLSLTWERPRVTTFDRVHGVSVETGHSLWTFQAQLRF